MALYDSYDSPLSYETAEEHKRRQEAARQRAIDEEARRFKQRVDEQQAQRQASIDVEAQRFQQRAQPHVQRVQQESVEQEVGRFRQRVQGFQEQEKEVETFRTRAEGFRDKLRAEEARLQPSAEEEATFLGKRYTGRPGRGPLGPLGDVGRALDVPRQQVALPLARRLIPGDVPLEAALYPLPGVGPAAAVQAGAGRLLGRGVNIPEPMAEEAVSMAIDPLNLLPGVGWGGDIARAARRGVPVARGLAAERLGAGLARAGRAIDTEAALGGARAAGLEPLGMRFPEPVAAGRRVPRKAPPRGPGEPPIGGVPEEPFAANIRLSKYPEDIRATIKEWADANPEAVQAARRGVRSDAEVMEDARHLVEETGGNFGKLQRRWKPGEAWNAEELTAIRGTLRSKTEAVLEAAEAARAADSTQNHARLLLAMEEQARVQQIVHGVTAEAGRGLRAFRQEAFDAITANDTQKLQELLRRAGLDKGKVAAFADRIASLDLNNPVEVNNFLRSVDKPKAGDYVMEFWINSILSGPRTHIINSLSNAAFAAISPVERGLAAVIDVPLARLQGRAVQRFFGEVPADGFGALSGIDEGVRAALRTFRDGITPAQASKWEFRRIAFPGIAGRIIRLPGTLLEAADSLFYAINYRSALNAGIIRQARSEGLRGTQLVERIADLKLNPSAKSIAEAAKTAEYRLFRAEPGAISSGFMSLRESIPLGRFVLPFLRTPGNLLAAGLERSPFGLLNPSLWRNLAKKSPEASDQIARLLLGSGVAAGLGAMIANGTLEITGSVPVNPAERDRFFREGKQPFAIKIGGQWVQYRRLEPFNQPLAQLAAFTEAVRNKDSAGAQQIAAQVITTIGNNFASQTYLSGLSEFLDAIADPTKAGTRWGERVATGFMPFSAAQRTAAQVTDPYFREPETLMERFQAGIPGLSQEVPARLTAFGQPAPREALPWSPVTVTPEKQDIVNAELERLGVEVGFVGNTIAGYELNREEQAEYQELAGQVTELVLRDLIGLAAYASFTDLEKQKAIERAIDQSRDAVREYLLSRATEKAEVR